ncbi:DUF2799 domain-containing protein [Uliginosibacterium sp. 31-12]|uniref:DUF2799 domain-containing protein n=1 Tax=Uliginosibacterium sp. 31-12 TaxID=3062781 RepID=UPI0026E214D6|nr:DUF2799 domain-containing protein [Uliginosibacterium sp. 31-12]MDO6387209.1 DUF2799 domain-containing protein [Uliginosibacterium sp. 31-12]
MPRLHPAALPLLFVCLLAGCSTLSEDECRQGDWERVGYRDGQNGQAPERISTHRKSCSVYRLEPDETAWRLGRERGLNFYCTPANGLSAGRRGERYAGVCPERSEAAFLRGFEAGREIHLAREHIDYLEQEQRSIEVRMPGARNEEELRQYSNQLTRLRLERELAGRELRLSEQRAERLRW